MSLFCFVTVLDVLFGTKKRKVLQCGKVVLENAIDTTIMIVVNKLQYLDAKER